jgi:hypothetical protein
VHLLDDQGVVGPGGQGVLGHPGGGDIAAVATEQGDGQQAVLARDREAAQDAEVAAVRREPEGDVLGLGEIAELVGEDLRKAFAAGDAGDGRHVVGERDRR